MAKLISVGFGPRFDFDLRHGNTVRADIRRNIRAFERAIWHMNRQLLIEKFPKLVRASVLR